MTKKKTKITMENAIGTVAIRKPARPMRVLTPQGLASAVTMDSVAAAEPAAGGRTVGS
jgi:hypothetical protein